MFHLEHSVAGPAPWPWNRPFPPSVHNFRPETPDNSRFQLRNRLPAPSGPKPKSLYTSMTPRRGRPASGLMGWFARERGCTDEPPYRRFRFGTGRRHTGRQITGPAGNCRRQPGREWMRNNKEKLHRNRTGRGAANNLVDSPVYAEERQARLRQGLRILARIIARAHLRRQAELSGAAVPDPPTAGESQD